MRPRGLVSNATFKVKNEKHKGESILFFLKNYKKNEK